MSRMWHIHIVVLRLPDFWSNWNLEMLVFEERGKLEYAEKNLSEQGKEPTNFHFIQCRPKNFHFMFLVCRFHNFHEKPFSLIGNFNLYHLCSCL